ncbi:MAG: hypothetical protein ACJAZ2_001600 [Glaciecola sp.]|jgi:hypothetical protein
MRNIVCSFIVFLAIQVNVFSSEQLLSTDSVDITITDINQDSSVTIGAESFQNQSVAGKSDTLSLAQRDSLIDVFKKEKGNAKSEKPDSSLMYQEKQKSPKMAGLLSAMLPGAGQVYNRGWKAWWKVGVIYGGGYFLYRNMVLYNRGQEFYHGALVIHDQDTSAIVILSDLENYADTYKDVEDYIDMTGEQFALLKQGDIKLRFEGYRSSLQNMYLFSVVLYGFNILDAVVDAHLKSFDISDDISMKIKPSILNMNGSYKGLGPGLSVKLSFK